MTISEENRSYSRELGDMLRLRFIDLIGKDRA